MGRKKRMPGELPQDEPVISTEEQWQREVSYTAVYSVIARIYERFSSRWQVLQAFVIFNQKRSPHFLKFIQQQLDMLKRM